MSKPKPTDSELEILQIIWENGPSTVRFVNEQLSKNRPVVYTTTLKFMQIMTEKGLLTRSTEKVSHVYDAKVTKSDMQRDLTDSFISKVFNGSAASLMLQALGSTKPSKTEMEKIKKLIEELERKTKGGKNK